MGRVSSAVSQIALAGTPIHRLAARFQEHLYFPDPSPLYVAAGALAANMMDGSPVWLMLVGPPSCGGSVILMSLYGAEGVRGTGSFSEAALLSGVKKKDFVAGATGGLLRELEIDGYGRGALVIEDFTSILSLGQEQLKKVLAALRCIWNGEYMRDVGTDGGRQMKWQGQPGVLTKCTDAIDDPRNMSTAAEMGERFIYYRWPHSDGAAESRKALMNGTPRDTQTDLRKAVTKFVDETGLSWTHPIHRREFNAREMLRMIAISQIGARCRSAVRRDPYRGHIVSVAAAEMPMRLANELSQLWLAMEWIGVSSDECWAIARKIALDSMSATRKAVFTAVGESATTAVEVSERLRISRQTAQWTCEDLEAQEILDKVGPGTWIWSPWTRETWSRGWE